MRRNHWSSCLLVSAFVVSGLVSEARAADRIDPSGTYTWERVRRDSDEKVRGTLTLKADGDTITGTLAGGRGEPVQIQNGRLEGDTITFRYTRSRPDSDRAFTVTYRGKVTATGIKFTMEFGQSGRTREFEATKVPTVAAGVAGLWKFKLERESGEPLETSIRITGEGDQLKGLYKGPRRESEAKKIAFAEGVLSFEVSGELDDGGTYHVVYRGTVSGDTCKGKVEWRFGDRDGVMNFVGQREVKKELKVEQLLGTWHLASLRENGETRESTFTLTQQDGRLKGVFSSPRGEREATRVELKGNVLTFEMSSETDRGSFHVAYEGTVDGDSIKGTMKFKFGDREGTRDFSGKLEKKTTSL